MSESHRLIISSIDLLARREAGLTFAAEGIVVVLEAPAVAVVPVAGAVLEAGAPGFEKRLEVAVVAVVAGAVAAEEDAVAPPKRLGAAAAVVAGAVDVVVAGLAPNKEVAAAGCDVAVDVAGLGISVLTAGAEVAGVIEDVAAELVAPPKRLGVDAADVAVGAPPKRDGADVVAGAAVAPPKREGVLAEVVAVLAPPKSEGAEVAGAAVGAAPAGVVEAPPNNEGFCCAGPAAAPPPNSPPAGVPGVVAGFGAPKRPPAAGAAVAGVVEAAPPNKLGFAAGVVPKAAPRDGADEGADAGVVLAPPNRFEPPAAPKVGLFSDEGVAEAPPPKRPPLGAVVFPPPKSDPAGLAAAVAFCPNEKVFDVAGGGPAGVVEAVAPKSPPGLFALPNSEATFLSVSSSALLGHSYVC